MKLTKFLEARIEEDERRAYDVMGEREGDRTLAECAAKRAIIAGIIPERDPHAGHPDYDPLWVIRELAAVYRDHPDYKQEWDQ